MKLLVVDDSATMRRIIINTLKRNRQEEIVEAEDGADAYAKLETESGIDFIITDWNMPNMSGLEFVNKVRGGDFKKIPILIVTARSIKKDIIEAIKAGVNSYIVKPFTRVTQQEKTDKILESLS
ncbi:MAG: response regulator [Candidatus Glassbacteria bacterium]|nr:response regulator [Candidatus Glassbacteria bacterium]